MPGAPHECSFLKQYCCNIVTKLVEDHEDNVRHGAIQIQNRPSPKMQSFCKLLAKELRIVDTTRDYCIQKHHFSRNVMEWCKNDNTNVSTPIIKETLLKVLEFMSPSIHGKRFFLANNKFHTTEDYFLQKTSNNRTRILVWWDKLHQNIQLHRIPIERMD